MPVSSALNPEAHFAFGDASVSRKERLKHDMPSAINCDPCTLSKSLAGVCLASGLPHGITVGSAIYLVSAFTQAAERTLRQKTVLAREGIDAGNILSRFAKNMVLKLVTP